MDREIDISIEWGKQKIVNTKNNQHAQFISLFLYKEGFRVYQSQSGRVAMNMSLALIGKKKKKKLR